MVGVEVEGEGAVEALGRAGSEAGEALAGAGKAEGGGLVDVVAVIGALEAVVAGRAVGTALPAGLASVGGHVAVLAQRTLVDALCDIEEGGVLAAGAVGAVEAEEAVGGAGRADHVGGVVEPVGGAVFEASVIADGHEVGGAALETSSVEGVPAGRTGNMALGASRGKVGVIVALVADALVALEGAGGVAVAEEAVAEIASTADCAGEVAGQAGVVVALAVVIVEAGAEGVRVVGVVLGPVERPVPAGFAGGAGLVVETGEAGQVAPLAEFDRLQGVIIADDAVT